MKSAIVASTLLLACLPASWGIEYCRSGIKAVKFVDADDQADIFADLGASARGPNAFSDVFLDAVTLTDNFDKSQYYAAVTNEGDEGLLYSVLDSSLIDCRYMLTTRFVKIKKLGCVARPDIRKKRLCSQAFSRLGVEMYGEKDVQQFLDASSVQLKDSSSTNVYLTQSGSGELTFTLDQVDTVVNERGETSSASVSVSGTSIGDNGNQTVETNTRVTNRGASANTNLNQSSQSD